MSNIVFIERNPLQDEILKEVNILFNEKISTNEENLKKEITEILKKYGKKIENISCKVKSLKLDKYGIRYTFFLDNISTLHFSIFPDEKVIAKKLSAYKYNNNNNIE